ncbi:MAG: two-component sensor histidine kinase, partial [Lachnospiraceae bacterium]|nr:two-component sensor histidine kinase [Lachnospiraceae bacterium]
RREFLSNVSHELKTPIALIRGYAEGLQEGMGEDPESRDFYCDVIVDEATKMNQMVQKLLTLNQLEFGNDIVELERFDLTALISNALQTGLLLARQQGITVEMREYPACHVWADAFMVEEVLQNYFSNALHYCTGEKRVEISLEETEDKIRVKVFNTGKQIPEESLPFLWDKFYKVDKARTREYGGSGVGLSIVKAIMESMHQKYGVRNMENGVEFWFELERADAGKEKQCG